MAGNKAKDVVEERTEEKQSMAVVVSGGITLAKFYDEYAPTTDKYIRAYLTTQFSGVLKSPDEWAQELAKNK